MYDIWANMGKYGQLWVASSAKQGKYGLLRQRSRANMGCFVSEAGQIWAKQELTKFFVIQFFFIKKIKKIEL